jgi:hypothetical protein
LIESNSEDEYGSISIKYDVQGDSIITDLMIYNQLRLAQSVNEQGEHIAILSNDNPYTFTMPGSSVFRLDIQQPRKERLIGVGIHAGMYVDKSLKIQPGLGVGIHYDIGKALMRRLKK